MTKFETAGYVGIAEGHICGFGATQEEAMTAAKKVSDRGVHVWPATEAVLKALEENRSPQGRPGGVRWCWTDGVVMLLSESPAVPGTTSDPGYHPGQVPCSLCNSPHGWSGTKLCDGCWELKRRIEWRPELALRILKEMGRC